ncbi:hypothetical protein B0H14DRAFT_2640221 [Mycena olivaceomarginata]|nr:hypothetical protein B0H14DRAFT_2640221 [Mycena olivaceomarginata]
MNCETNGSIVVALESSVRGEWRWIVCVGFRKSEGFRGAQWPKENAFTRTLATRRIRGTIPWNRVDRLPHILRSFAQFKYHLWRSQADELEDNEVSMELKKLGGRLQMKVQSKQLLGSNTAIPMDFNGRSGPLNLMVHNQTPARLYIYIFYFGSDLAISPVFLPGSGSQQARSDFVLAGNQKFSIGLGDGGPTISFSLPAGHDVDIGFFKLFATTVPVDFFSLLQDSPFSAEVPTQGRHAPGEKTLVNYRGSQSDNGSHQSGVSRQIYSYDRLIRRNKLIRPGAPLRAWRGIDPPGSSQPDSTEPEWYPKTVPVIQRRSRRS